MSKKKKSTLKKQRLKKTSKVLFSINELKSICKLAGLEKWGIK